MEIILNNIKVTKWVAQDMLEHAAYMGGISEPEQPRFENWGDWADFHKQLKKQIEG